MTTIKKEIDVEAKTVTWDYGNGTTTVVKLEELSPEMQLHLALCGISHKAGDSYAGAKKAVENNEAEDVETYAKECVESIWANLKAGTFNAKRESSGETGVTLLAKAIAKVRGMELAAVIEKLNTLEPEQKKAIQATPSIQLAIIELRKENEARREAKLRAKLATDGPAEIEGF